MFPSNGLDFNEIYLNLLLLKVARFF